MDVIKQQPIPSPAKEHLGAFSLASLEQGNRSGSLSLVNLNVNFDTSAFLKSGSFDCLSGYGLSQFFKQDPSSSLNPEVIKGTFDPNHNNAQPNNLNAVGAPSQSTPTLSVNVKSIIPASIPSNVLSTSISNPQQQSNTNNSNHHNAMTINHINSPSSQHMVSFGSHALIQPKETSSEHRERKDDNSKFVDVTPFLTLPQHEAAKKLGIPSSTLAKRWKEASCNRKWPYRTVSKLDKEILTLLKNVENAKTELSPSVEATLGLLLKKRQEELKTVLVRL